MLFLFVFFLPQSNESYVKSHGGTQNLKWIPESCLAVSAEKTWKTEKTAEKT